MKEFNFLIDGQPMSKKRNWTIVRTRGGRPRIALTKEYKMWQKSVEDQLWVQKTQYMASMLGLWRTIDEPIEVTFLFYIKGKKRYDLSNLYQGIEDALVQANIIEDDSLIGSHDGSRKFQGVDNPHIQITIKPIYGPWIHNPLGEIK